MVSHRALGNHGMTVSITAEASADQVRLASKPHFAVMDGLRGVAALAVVLLHSFDDKKIVVNGQLAVDLFFILSGFVIAYSYDDKLATKMSRSEFSLRRFIRLYPMLFLGALGGICVALIHNRTNPAEAYPFTSVLASGGLSMFVLPYFSDAILQRGFSTPAIFSFDPPIWSLFFEIAANIVYVFAFRRLTLPVLAAIVLVGVAGVVWFGSLGGGGQANFWAGFPRVACGFFGGVLLFKLRRMERFPRLNIPPLVLVFATVAVLCWPIEVAGASFVVVYPVLCVIVLCASVARPSRFDRLYMFLGLISYPVYIIHWHTMYVFVWVGTKLLGFADAYTIAVLVHMLAIPFIGFAFAHLFETPVRLFLTRHLLRSPSGGRKAALPQQAT